MVFSIFWSGNLACRTNVGTPESSQTRCPKKCFFVFLKNRNVAKMGIRLETGVLRIRTYEGIFELNSMFHNPAPKNILGYREPEFVSKNIFFLRSEAKVARFRRQKNVWSRYTWGAQDGGILRSLASGSGPGRTCPGDFLGGNADPTNFAIMATIVWYLFFWELVF